MKLHSRTPLVLQRALSTPAQRIWFKLENLQPCGSYKLRGIGALCQHAYIQGKRRLVATSGGNAGIAAAWAGRELGMQTEVIVPLTTPEATRARIAALGRRGPSCTVSRGTNRMNSRVPARARPMRSTFPRSTIR